MKEGARARRVVIMGAAGRDFHNFNVVYRDDPTVEVVAFTAAQIPGIAGRRYPPALAGARYPTGIPIEDEARLEALLRRERIDEVVFAYSDVRHETVMHVASRALAAGADFALLGPRRTMIESRRPVIAVSAVRTGCGKSQTVRHLAERLAEKRLRIAALRHPMPYGDLAAQAVQRFASRADLDAAHATIEEREEYEPYIERGAVVFAGVDYARILDAAEREADLILWDGGNNDFPFLRPDLHIVLVDALRPGHETAYHPGETCLRIADIVVIAKANAASAEVVDALDASVGAVRPSAPIVRAASVVRLDDESVARGRRVLVVEDGPTITHGGMATGAGYAAACAAGVREIIDPRAAAVGEIAATFRKFPHIGPVLPAMGYGAVQLAALRETIARSGAELVIAGTPIDLAGDLGLEVPVVRARYDYQDMGEPALWPLVARFLGTLGLC
jgi:predicted GTPase